MPVPTFRELWTDLKLLLRGQVRCAPYGTRGRTHRPLRAAPSPAGTMGPAKSEPQGYISARVYREATGEWEDLGVIAEAEVDIINNIRAQE